MAKTKRKGNSLEARQRRAGFTFVIHYVIGLLLFFSYPLVSSIIYSFSDVRIEPGQIVTDFVGVKYFEKLLVTDPNYINDVRDSLGMMFYSLPIILALSLILAVILNQKFKGRTVVRAIFFLSVILSGSVVMIQLNSTAVRMPIFSQVESGGAIDYNAIISQLNLPDALTTILVFLLANTVNLVWSCGIQTILFLAGLQSIPASMYEVSKIEGANIWEEFWFITIPSLRHIISLNMIYTMIDLFASNENTVVAKAYSEMIAQNFGEGSAMLWFYFIIVIVVILIVYGLYQRLCVKRWE